jgi:hypothetical protein
VPPVIKRNGIKILAAHTYAAADLSAVEVSMS